MNKFTIDSDPLSDSDSDSNDAASVHLVQELDKTDAELNDELIKKIPQSLKLYFQTKIDEADPNLILKAPSGKYNSYARLCQLNSYRQPVIIGDKDLADLNKEFPGFIRPQDVVRYGSEPGTEQNYMCPRYWCLKTNKPLDPRSLSKDPVTGELEHVVKDANGKTIEHLSCGKVLEENAIEVKHGRYIYDFTGARDESYPGLISNKHPKGHCLPCCFKKWDTAKRKAENAECFHKKANAKSNAIANANANAKSDADANADAVPHPAAEEEEAAVKPVRATTPLPAYTVDPEPEPPLAGDPAPISAAATVASSAPKQVHYILAADKMHVGVGRWGYLPIQMQQVLKTLNVNCQVSVENVDLKPDYPCMLRYGVEASDTQSFLAAISSAAWMYSTGPAKRPKPLSIAGFKKSIIQFLSSKALLSHDGTDEYGLDKFIRYQNGNLVSIFCRPEINFGADPAAFNRDHPSVVFTKLNMAVEADAQYYRRVMSAFESFVSFLRDDSTVIDHTYMWDLVSSANEAIFPSGANLIIFNIPDNDITSNIDLVCPTNFYASPYYTHAKPYLILIKHYDYYEPVFSFTSGSRPKIIPLFHEKTASIHPAVKSLLATVIKPFMQSKCGTASEPFSGDGITAYPFKRPLLLNALIRQLVGYKYTVTAQIMNFNNKIIGVVARSPRKKTGFVPCFPSSKYDGDFIPYVFMTDPDIWQPYFDTIEFLIELSKRSGKRRPAPDIPCLPLWKIVEDEHVVGVLTETNQFVQTSEPMLESEANTYRSYQVPTLKDRQYLLPGTGQGASQGVQVDAVIATSSAVDTRRSEYIGKIRADAKLYAAFRSAVGVLLHKYTNAVKLEEIRDHGSSPYLEHGEKLALIEDVLREITGKKITFTGGDDYNHQANPIAPKEGDALVLPAVHLLSGGDARAIYFSKLADELARFSRVQSAMLDSAGQPTFDRVEYAVRDDEVILFRDEINGGEYFDNLVEAPVNAYAKFATYDSAVPQNYENYPRTTVGMAGDSDENCPATPAERVSSAEWRHRLPDTFGEFEYGASAGCTFAFVIDLIRRATGRTVSRAEVETRLYLRYIANMEKHKTALTDVLSSEGKHLLINQFVGGVVKFNQVVYAPTYFISPTDLWVLMDEYSIPAAFISQTPIRQAALTAHPTIFFIGSTKAVQSAAPDAVVFIVLPGIRKYGGVPVYRVIKTADDAIRVDLAAVSPETRKLVAEAAQTAVPFETYLANYTPEPAKKRIRHRQKYPKVQLILEEETPPPS